MVADQDFVGVNASLFIFMIAAKGSQRFRITLSTIVTVSTAEKICSKKILYRGG